MSWMSPDANFFMSTPCGAAPRTMRIPGGPTPTPLNWQSQRSPIAQSPSLGSALAKKAWTWSPDPAQAPAPDPSRNIWGVVRLRKQTLDAMAAVAEKSGQSLSDAWCEAAQLWLSLHTNDGDPNPPGPAAPALERPARWRDWHDIDVLLDTLRSASAHDRQSVAA